MNKYLDFKELRQPSEPKKAGLVRRMLRFLAKMFSGAKGDQGDGRAARAGLLTGILLDMTYRPTVTNHWQ